MEFIDYYKILELNKNATEADIKKAYRRLARKLHPDLNPNDREASKKFQALNEANEVLSDPEKRKKYDKYGKDWEHGEEYEKYRKTQQERSSYSGGQQYSGGPQFSGSEDFSDFFSSMFGEQSRGGSKVTFKGQDINAEIKIDFNEIFKTHQQTFNLNGKNIRITIPSGIEDGQIIKLSGYGGNGMNGGPNGNLYISFSITNNSKFKRIGNDLHTMIELDLYTAILGGEIFLETFDGKIKLNVAPETQNGTQVRLKGKGVPVYKKEGEFGDLYVTYKVKLPTHLNEKQKELFKELAKLSN